jgi:hypothetical protein
VRAWPPPARGLNTTTPFTQGWKDSGLKAGTKCLDCTRKVLSNDDPDFRRYDWRFADPSRPSQDHLRCHNCDHYIRTHGVVRPEYMEVARSQRGPSKPTRCEVPGLVCQVTKIRFVSRVGLFLCSSHNNQAASNQKKGLPPNEWFSKVQKRASMVPATKAGRARPAHCEVPGCNTAKGLKFLGIASLFLCMGPANQARAGEKERVPQSQWFRPVKAIRAPSTPRVKAPRPKPAQCEGPSCVNTTISYQGISSMFLCSSHKDQAKKANAKGLPQSQWLFVIGTSR